MLDLLDASFLVLAKGPAADAAQIASVRQRFATVPREYLELAVEATEIELQHKGGQYIRIWGPKGCIEMDEGYGIGQRIPGAIPIGDDGGGQVIFYLDGKQGFGLYHVGYGNLDCGAAVYVARSLADLLTRSIGIGTF
jgi:hypothetical protein